MFGVVGICYMVAIVRVAVVVVLVVVAFGTLSTCLLLLHLWLGSRILLLADIL